MISYSFQDVLAWLDKNTPPKTLELDLRQSTWVVVAINSPDTQRIESGAFLRLLAEKPEVLRNKKVVVFALNAPYYLDATDISKITAYYGIYGNTAASVDEAARILFQDIPARGASPVSIPGVGYDLITATSPDPRQLIPLMLDIPDQRSDTGQGPELSQATPTVGPIFNIGDTLPMRTGVILDHNGHQVPDETVVRFIINTGGETVTTQQIESTTRDGIARASYRISDRGMLQIHVISEPALTSEILQLDVRSDIGAAITAVAPTPVPTETPVATITTTVQPTEVNGTIQNETKPGGWVWFFSMALLALVCWLVFQVGKTMLNIRWGIRWGLCALIGGIAGYLWVSTGLPGGSTWYQLTGNAGLIGAVLVAGALGWSAGILWYGLGSKSMNR
jgi:beta-N-acetylhexosaminidase